MRYRVLLNRTVIVNNFWARQRVRFSEWGLLRTIGYYVFGVAPDKLGIKLLSAFELTSQPSKILPSPQTSFSFLASEEDWSADDLKVMREFLSERDLQLFRAFAARGDKCVVARCDGGQLASLCWIEETTRYCFARDCRGFVIHNAYTSPQYRGKGLFPQTLVYACRCLRDSESTSARIFVDCSVVNYPSKRGIQKAGFTPIGTILNASRLTWSWAARLSSPVCKPDAINVR